MQGITLAIGIISSALCVCLRAPYALATYVIVLVWYPDYLRISLGTIDISAGRIVVAILLLRCLCDKRISRKFTWSRFDTLIALSMAIYVGIYCFMYPVFSMSVENRSGFLMDTWFAYMATRLTITNKDDLVSFAKIVGLALVPLAIVGLIECTTHRYFFIHLKSFRPWDIPVGSVSITGRQGHARAVGPSSHPIMFGSCFIMLLPIIWTLRRQNNYWRKISYIMVGFACLGALSSWQSNSWITLIALVFFLMMERFTRLVKPLIICFIAFCLLVEMISNQHFYHVLYKLANITGGTWWQRVALIDSAIRDFGDWWLAGYGGRDPLWVARASNGRTDANNEFIKAGMLYGLPGVIALCVVLASAFNRLAKAFKQTMDKELKSICWALGSSVLAVIVNWQGVSFFGTSVSLFYCILGLVGSFTGLAIAKPQRIAA
ncbi:MAG: hypothetical protein FVQ82_07730 [Planctomycetes bacterium]|nr:hypothetical protein [Planctomycetota bacterium]